jgi:hypothetical protein
MPNKTKTQLTEMVPVTPGRNNLRVDAGSATASRHRYWSGCRQFHPAMACAKHAAPPARMAPMYSLAQVPMSLIAYRQIPGAR